MIIKGASRSNGPQLGAYLRDTQRNDDVEIISVAHGETDNLDEALAAMQAMTGTGQRGHKGLYHAQIAPEPGADMDREDWSMAADTLGRELGLDDQPRAIVLHSCDNHTHAHVVWQRTDPESLTLRSDSWNYIAHEQAARHIEHVLQHNEVQGVHTGGNERSDSYGNQERAQAERSGYSPANLRTHVTQAWQEADSGAAFKNALDDKGLVLARGDKRGYVVVDPDGEVYSLSRQVEGVRSKEVKERLADIDQDTLPDVPQAREQQAERETDAQQLQQTPETVSSDTTVETEQSTHMRDAPRYSGTQAEIAQTMAAEISEQKDRQLQAEQASQARHEKQCERFEARAQERVAAAERADPEPGKIKTGWLKLTQRYDGYMQARAERFEALHADNAIERSKLEAGQVDEEAALREAYQARRSALDKHQETYLTAHDADATVRTLRDRYLAEGRVERPERDTQEYNRSSYYSREQGLNLEAVREDTKQDDTGEKQQENQDQQQRH